MKKIIFITLIFISILVSKNLFPYRFNEKLLITHEALSIKNLNQIDRNKSKLYKNPVVAFGSSLLIPGLGQYYLDGEKYWKRIAVYSLLEIIGAIGMVHYSRKAIGAKDNYEDWADNHWSFERWLYNYDKIDTGDNYIFDDDISSGSHYIQFVYEDKTYKTTDQSFYNDIYLDIVKESNSVQELEELGFRVYKTHDYYEEVGKYDHFFGGWDDSGNFQIVDIGELNITSVNKNKYLDLRDVSEDFYNFSEYYGILLFLNHAVSATDALILTQLTNGSIRIKSTSKIEKNSSLFLGLKLVINL